MILYHVRDFNVYLSDYNIVTPHCQNWLTNSKDKLLFMNYKDYSDVKKLHLLKDV